MGHNIIGQTGHSLLTAELLVFIVKIMLFIIYVIKLCIQYTFYDYIGKDVTYTGSILFNALRNSGNEMRFRLHSDVKVKMLTQSLIKKLQRIA